jgi:type IV pilus assembly protein PilO
LNEELRDALTQLPNEKEIPEILKTISSLGKESYLEFTLFRPKPEQPKQFFANVPIELVALGSYHNAGMFFDKVSKLPRITNVVDFSLINTRDMTKDTASVKEMKGKRESEILLRISCVISTYRFIEMKSEEKKSETKAGPKAGDAGTSKTSKK